MCVCTPSVPMWKWEVETRAKTIFCVSPEGQDILISKVPTSILISSPLCSGYFYMLCIFIYLAMYMRLRYSFRGKGGSEFKTLKHMWLPPWCSQAELTVKECTGREGRGKGPDYLNMALLIDNLAALFVTAPDRAMSLSCHRAATLLRCSSGETLRFLWCLTETNNRQFIIKHHITWC